jgi:hypothetical protein
MPWETIEFSDGAFEVNREGVLRIMRSSAWSRAVVSHSFTEVKLHGFEGEPQLVLHNVSIDLPAVRADTDRDSDAFFQEFFWRAANGMMSGKQAVDHLAGLIDQKDGFDRDMQKKRKAAQTQTMANINAAVEFGEKVLPILQAIRDIAADAAIIGATVLSGGGLTPAITEAMAAGASLKGVGKWQDTGRFQDGLVEFSTELGFGLIGGGLKGMKSEAVTRPLKWALVLVMSFIKGGVEFVKQVMSGKSTAEAFGRAGTKNVDPVIGAVAGQVLGAESGLAVPITAILKYGAKMGADALTKPTAAKPAVTNTDMFDAARPTAEFIAATAVQRFPGMSRQPRMSL